MANFWHKPVYVNWLIRNKKSVTLTAGLRWFESPEWLVGKYSSCYGRLLTDNVSRLLMEAQFDTPRAVFDSPKTLIPQAPDNAKLLPAH